jgi:hypothetical protein
MFPAVIQMRRYIRKAVAVLTSSTSWAWPNTTLSQNCKEFRDSITFDLLNNEEVGSRSIKAYCQEKQSPKIIPGSKAPPGSYTK